MHSRPNEHVGLSFRNGGYNDPESMLVKSHLRRTCRAPIMKFDIGNSSSLHRSVRA